MWRRCGWFERFLLARGILLSWARAKFEEHSGRLAQRIETFNKTRRFKNRQFAQPKEWTQ